MATGRLSSWDRSLQHMQWEIVGYARGFACSAAMERFKYWEAGIAGKQTRKDMSKHGVVPAIPGSKGLGISQYYRDPTNKMYTLAVKVPEPMPTMFHTSPLCGGGSYHAALRWNSGHDSGTFHRWSLMYTQRWVFSRSMRCRAGTWREWVIVWRQPLVST